MIADAQTSLLLIVLTSIAKDKWEIFEKVQKRKTRPIPISRVLRVFSDRQTDRLTDQPTNQQTEWLIELRTRD